MKSILRIFLPAFAAVLCLSSCSGLKNNTCVTNCGGGGSGNASLTISMYDTPPTGVAVLSFTLPITSISLTPATGSDFTVPTLVTSVEVTRLQTDSDRIASAVSVPAGSYKSINVTIGPTTTTANAFINSSSSTITYGTNGNSTCLPGAVCRLPVGAITTVTIPLSLTLTANRNQWIGLDFNLNNAITTSNGISVDFTQAGVLTATTTLRKNIPSGGVDTLDDFTGRVTAYTSGSTISVKSDVRGTLTAAITSSTTYDDPQPQCSGSPTVQQCIKPGSIVSVQGIITPSGTVTATEIDVIDANATVDEVEGVVYPSNCNGAGSFGMILADSTVVTGNTLLGGLTAGAGLCLTPSLATYIVDSGPLFAAIHQPPVGFGSGSDIIAGQVIRAQVTSVTSGTLVDATATRLILRFSRLTGTVNTPGATFFTVNNLPAYLNLLTSPQVGTYPNNTIFDGLTVTSDLTNGETVSFRALYLNPGSGANPVFLANKVRVP